jgi:hypothetical protein
MSARTPITHEGFPDEFFATGVQKVIRKWSKREDTKWPATRAAFNVVSDCAGLDCSTPAKVGALSRRGQLDHYGKAFLLAYKKRSELFVELLAAVDRAVRTPPRSVRDIASRVSFIVGEDGQLQHKEIADVVAKLLHRPVSEAFIRNELSKENTRRVRILRKLRVTENAGKV